MLINNLKRNGLLSLVLRVLFSTFTLTTVKTTYVNHYILMALFHQEIEFSRGICDGIYDYSEAIVNFISYEYHIVFSHHEYSFVSDYVL